MIAPIEGFCNTDIETSTGSTRGAGSTPVCRHSGVCGGCSEQHREPKDYLEWKRRHIVSELSRAGIDAGSKLAPLTVYPLASRRRAVFSASGHPSFPVLGFKEARGATVVPLTECAVVHPEIFKVLPSVRKVLSPMMTANTSARISLTLTANGIDCGIDGVGRGTAGPHLHGLREAGVIRFLQDGEPVFQTAIPTVQFAGVPVDLPSRAFLQAVEACEKDMAAFVTGALATVAAGSVCDLFAGLGAFTFPCAHTRAVSAYEASGDAVTAIANATRRASKLKPVAATRRDLFRNPLGTAELNRFAAAIVDPPREGAEGQCRALAASSLNTVIMVSCNPATFARDASHLTRAGFELSDIRGFDQFQFTRHVEVASVFRREPARRKR